MSEAAEVPVIIEILGLGKIEAVLIRHISPISVDAILNKLPFVVRGRFGFGGKQYWTLSGVGIRKGTNQKAKKEVEQGDIIYNPKADEISIIIEAHEMQNKVNLIGKVISNLELLQQVRNGLNNKISRI
ncbi:MAG: cyclophilin-like family protein [Promethearchaeota archaeon]